jgi:acyl dehydratase
MNDAAFPPSLELQCGPIAAIDLALFAAASGDHNPLHLDADVASAAGFDRPVVHGMLTMACVARLFTSWFGAGCVRALQTRFTGVAKLGDTLQINASLSGVTDNIGSYDVRATTASGTELVSGTARIVTPSTTHTASTAAPTSEAPA